MSVGPNRWREQRKAARANRLRPTIEACEVRPRRGAAGYEVTIRGSDLVTPGVFVDARIGDQRITDLRLTSAREFTGVLAEEPRARELVYTVGSLEARGPVTMVSRSTTLGAGDVPELLSRWWGRIRRKVRGG
jgi:hypothetical protein